VVVEVEEELDFVLPGKGYWIKLKNEAKIFWEE